MEEVILLMRQQYVKAFPRRRYLGLTGSDVATLTMAFPVP